MANVFKDGSLAVKYASALDEAFEEKSVTSHFEDPVMKEQFVGAKQVSIPDMDLSGLGNYDRANGFQDGVITLDRKVYEIKNDRAKSFSLDRMDADETGVAEIAGKVMGAFVRTRVVPEVDAYVMSQLAAVAKEKNNLVGWNADKPFATFNSLLSGVQEACGYDEEIICFVDTTAFGALKNSNEFNKNVINSNFEGKINSVVKTVDNVSIIPVPGKRMKDLVALLDTEAGGFSTDGGKDIRMIMLPKRGAHLVKKTEKVRVFTPDENQKMDAYKFDYRIYYDIFVRKSEVDSIWASIVQ